MQSTQIKQRYGVAELLAFALPGMPTTRAAIHVKAEREGWKFQETTGKGGVRREYVLPSEIMRQIERTAATRLIATMSTEIVTREPHHPAPVAMTFNQSLVADARKGVLAALNGLMAKSGYAMKKAARVLLEMAERGDAPPQLSNMLRAARDGRGRPSASGLPSVSSLLRFVEYDRAGSLAPRFQQRDMTVPAWAPLFMECYQKPEKPTVNHAYETFCCLAPAQGLDKLPSIWQVRRFLDKVGKVSLEMGRMGDRELKTIRPFIRRSFKDLLPTDIYSADGHTFDAEVQHPLHGRPFRPEITSVVDIATRRLVGWSVGLAESAFAVLDALRHASVKSGIPAIFYVDNGSGYKNQLMTDSATGLLGRLGTEMHNSIPYNSQARGVIERLHQTIWVKAAKEVPGYMGRDMDRQASQVIHKLSRQAIARTASGGAVAMPLMAWSSFLEFCDGKASEYNSRPHRSLPKIVDPLNGRKRHMTPDEAWQLAVDKGFQASVVTDDEARPLFRPQQLRTVRRAEIELFGNRYFARSLEEFHGEQLAIGYDIHDGSKVWVYDADGRFICTAEHNANERAYMPASAVDKARDKRAAGRERRLETKLEEVQLERRGAPALENMESVHIPGFMNIDRDQLAQRARDLVFASPAVHADAEIVEVREVSVAPEWAAPTEPQHRYAEWLRISKMEEGELSERQKNWRQSYTATSEFRVYSKKTA
ncbi:putative transposase [Duganella sp. SG902]|uniref:Mu transposase C-terminal domain-containing protein n=1 Tax=Duganella sp. SG902 TaxID=2587016 RepID=UPI00159D1A8B|nr:Mu transposase C-terminal domain-containing protein [Duganella sp. SG902]NVM78872.1 putative transposase [Duganella sp. SG902]